MKTLLVSLAVLALAVLFADPVNLLKPANNKDSWRFETAGESKGEMVIVEDAVEFTASEAVDKKNRISFVLGYNKGSVFVKDLTMVVK